jgi:hypothetical protein
MTTLPFHQALPRLGEMRPAATLCAFCSAFAEVRHLQSDLLASIVAQLPSFLADTGAAFDQVVSAVLQPLRQQVDSCWAHMPFAVPCMT